MSNELEPGATPAPTQPATGTQPQGTQTGATPTIQPDTLAEITEWKSRSQSADARIKELNKENLGHRTKAEEATTALETERENTKAYQVFGKPSDIQAKLDKLAEYEKAEVETTAKAERTKTLKGVSEAAEMDLEALEELDRPDYSYEVKEEKKGNVTTKTVLVNGVEIDEKFKRHLPSLRPARTPAPGARPTPPPAPGSTSPIIRQSPGVF